MIKTLVSTNAPEVYDGFGTKTIAIQENGLRLVMIDPEHVEWQTLRYASGLYIRTVSLRNVLMVNRDAEVISKFVEHLKSQGIALARENTDAESDQRLYELDADGVVEDYLK